MKRIKTTVRQVTRAKVVSGQVPGGACEDFHCAFTGLAGLGAGV